MLIGNDSIYETHSRICIPTWLGTELNNMQLGCNLSSIERLSGKGNQNGRVLIPWNLFKTINFNETICQYVHIYQHISANGRGKRIYKDLEMQ